MGHLHFLLDKMGLDEMGWHQKKGHLSVFSALSRLCVLRPCSQRVTLSLQCESQILVSRTAVRVARRYHEDVTASECGQTQTKTNAVNLGLRQSPFGYKAQILISGVSSHFRTLVPILQRFPLAWNMKSHRLWLGQPACSMLLTFSWQWCRCKWISHWESSPMVQNYSWHTVSNSHRKSQNETKLH